MQTALARSNAQTLSGFASSIPGKIVLGLAATAIVAAAAHAVVPLPFTPVPFILTPLAVLGVGLAFGPVAGFFVMLTYLAEGAMGLPVFSPTGPGGIAQLLGPTGGFLMSYPLVALLVGAIARSLTPRVSRFAAAAIGGVVAVALLFLCGAAWLSVIAHLTLRETWVAAVGPFLPGEAIKILCAAGIFSALSRTARS